MNSFYEEGLDRCPANYAPLSPIDFLMRSAAVYPDRIAIVDGDRTLSWGQLGKRCKQFASALLEYGIGKNDTVSIIAPNSESIYTAHFAVPMAGAVLNTINTRLDAATIAFILQHGEAKALIVDGEFAEVASEAVGLLSDDFRKRLLVIDVSVTGVDLRIGETDLERFIASGSLESELPPLQDEWDAISLNYTSGTTGNPKGVVYHHRGAYLNAMSNIIGWNMSHHANYLWTLPMFHCNGWCFPWSLAAVAGTSICLRDIDAASIFNAIDQHQITHFCGAPIIMNMLINAREEERKAFKHSIHMMTAAAPPPASVLQAMERAGFHVTHVYGLTETYGPAVICAWNPDWDQLNANDKADKNARQGVPYHVLQGLDVMNPDTMEAVEADAEQLGEAMFRGNIVMKGYLKNPDATRDAFSGGWFHSGDLGVMHPDGYLQLKDRSKDVIISGGENISSIEVEDCLYKHPDVIEAAVVAKPDEYWGETPCAFVGLKAGAVTTEKEVIDFCRQNLAHYKCPKTVIFGELPKTSTGKIQKFRLREQLTGAD